MPAIEIAMGAITVRMSSGTDIMTLQAVLRAVIPVWCGARAVSDAAGGFPQRHGRLSALIRESQRGVVYVFWPKRIDRVKLLLWVGTRLVLVAKRPRDASHIIAALGAIGTNGLDAGAARCACARQATL